MLIHTWHTHTHTNWSRKCAMDVCFEFNLHHILIVNSVSQFAGLNLLSAIYPKLNLQNGVKGDQPHTLSISLSLSPFCLFLYFDSKVKCLLQNRYLATCLWMYVLVCVLMFIDWVTVSDCKIIGFILLTHSLAIHNEHTKKKIWFVTPPPHSDSNSDLNLHTQEKIAHRMRNQHFRWI